MMAFQSSPIIPPLKGEGDRWPQASGGGVSTCANGEYPSVSPAAIHLALQGRIGISARHVSLHPLSLNPAAP